MAGLRADCGTTDHGFVRNRIDDDRLLHESLEKLAAVPGSAPVEPEGEFIEVVFQMLMAHRSLVRAQNPPFEQRGYSVNPRHQFRCSFLFAVKNGDLMNVALTFSRKVCQPSVGMEGTARLDRLLQRKA